MVDAEIKEETNAPQAAPPPDEQTEVDLHELQIKLEKIRSYVKRTEMRITANENNLERLRQKQQEAENKKMAVSLAPRLNKTENQV